MSFDIDLPIRYFDTAVLAAAFPARTARLQALVPEPLRVVELWPGRAPLGIMCFDYRETTVGPYGEVAVCWPVVRSRRRPPPLLPLVIDGRWPEFGWWVHHLPVTTEIANYAGRTLWGYPKFVADIAFSWRDAQRVCTLAEHGEPILRLAVDTRLPARPQRFDVCTYTVLDGELLRTRIAVDAAGIRSRRGRAQLELGPHPIGREIAALGVDAGRPVEVRWYPTWRAVLPEAERRWPLARLDAPKAARAPEAA
ncbi:MAG: hypothetical protein D6689_00715 [Deltaproteobacteria bacterium]|nr:MAG: hypothetical protein D6689_00715 [Deltaproteobacteria bacterium]